ncbi:MAG TPA: Calx-beta domain-containing protein [Acidimicrobiales bacterium]
MPSLQSLRARRASALAVAAILVMSVVALARPGTAAPTDSVTITDVVANEGNSGDTTFTFTVTRTPGMTPTTASFLVNTSNGTAEEPGDYTAVENQPLVFAVGDTSETVNVTVKGDTTAEPDETFDIELTPIDGTECSPCEATGTIRNDEPSLSVANATPALIPEGGTGATTNAVFRVSLSPAAAQQVTVAYTTANGTATQPGDYTTTAGTLTFAIGETFKDVSVPVKGDVLHEANENFTLVLSAPTNAALQDATGEATIQDDDATPSLSVDDVQSTEGGAGPSFTVTLSAASGQTVTVNYATSNGTATAGADYTAASSGLTFAPGETTKNVSVIVVNDVLDEASETYTLTLSSAVNATIGDPSGAGTILDNDNPPNLAVSDPSVTEGNTGTANLVFTVSLDAASGQQVTVDYTTADGTATAGPDYTAKNGTLTFAPGDVQETVTVVVNGDTLDEGASETVDLNLSNAPLATIADAKGVGTINDDDNSPAITIASNGAVAEGGTGQTGKSAFTVTLTNASTQQVTVNYATAPGTATAGSDYTHETGQVVFVPGDTSEVVEVDVLGDIIDEANETFTVSLNTPANAVLGTPSSATGTITDDDAGPEVSIDDTSVTEGSGGSVEAVFNVSLSQTSGLPVTVTYTTSNGTATSGSDYTAETNQVVIPANTLTNTVTVTVTGDTVAEANETFFVVLTDPQNATLDDDRGVGTITNDDAGTPPSLSINDVAITEGNTGSQNLVFTVTRTGAASETVTVKATTSNGTATAGSDYTATTQTVSFNATGASTATQTFTVPVLGDAIFEPNETFTVTLSENTNAVIGDATGTGTITENDAQPSITVDDPTIAEGDSAPTNGAFTLTLSGASASAVTVLVSTSNQTATAGEDYTAVPSTIVNFAPGATTATVPVTIAPDRKHEVDETFLLNLTTPSGATIGDATGTATITDNDTAPTVSVSNAEVQEGNTGTAKLQFTVSLSAPSGRVVTVQYDTSNGTATAGTDYTAKTAQTVTIPANTSSVVVEVDVAGDTVDEADETLTVTLSSPENATLDDATGTGTIRDDDASPSVSVDDNSVTETNASTTLTFKVRLSAASSTAVTVTASTDDGTAVNPADYTTKTQQLTFAPGDVEEDFVVTVAGDQLDELAETFDVVLSNVSSNASIHPNGDGVGTINDDDPPPALRIDDVAVTEGSTGTTAATFTVTLSPISGRSVTVQYTTEGATATAPSDYTTKSGTLTFDAGVLTQQVTVQVVGDNVDEPNEAFNVVLSSPSGATLADPTGVASIADDDEPAITPTTQATTTTTTQPAKQHGYVLAGGDGKVYAFGVEHRGDTTGQKLNQPIIGLTLTPSGKGYWLVAKDGGIFTFGDADFWGSMGGTPLSAPVLGMESTPTGKGYWLFAADGGIFNFGDATFYGSTGNDKLNAPMIGMETTSSGNGYWLVAQDGGIFTFGKAPFHGSTGGDKLNEPVFDMAALADGTGYWLVARDGGIFSFGKVGFFGSAVGKATATVIGIGDTPTGKGYWIADANGAVMAFGDATFLGDVRSNKPAAPVVGFASRQ